MSTAAEAISMTRSVPTATRDTLPAQELKNAWNKPVARADFDYGAYAKEGIEAWPRQHSSRER
jgi:hypothetical protein